MSVTTLGLLMRRVAVLTAALAAFSAAAPGSADAGIVRVIPLHERDAVEYRDDDGISDDLRVSFSGKTMIVSGPGVVPSTGCVARPDGVACTVQVTPPYMRASLGAGDDRLVADEPLAVDVFGGPGNDDVRVPFGSLEGEAGNDTLVLTGGFGDLDSAGPARLLGQDGDDRLIAGGAPAEIAGGPGRDTIIDSPFDDVLVGADDDGAGDSIECRGGDDYIERDKLDGIVRCSPKPLNLLSRIRFKWKTYKRTGITVFPRLAVAFPGLSFSQGRLVGSCRGRACRGARLRVDYQGREFERFRISGGVAAPNGRRGVLAGATVFVGFEIRVGGVAFRKGMEFRPRRRAGPRIRKLCHTRRAGAAWRAVPCERSARVSRVRR